MSISCRPTNGVSYGVKYVVTADDVTAGFIDFDFRIADTYHFDLVAAVQVLAETTNIVTNPADLAISYPEKGVIKVTATLVAGSVVNLIAQAVQP